MTDLVRLLVLYLAAVNPPRLLGMVPAAGTRVAAVGAAVAAGVVWVLAALSGPLLDALDITRPTARVAAGIVAGGAGLWHLLGPAPRPWSDTGRMGPALVPVAFPVLLRPEVALVGLSTGADHGVVAALVAAWVALAVGAAALGISRDDNRLARAAGRVLGAVLVLLGIDLVVDGVLDV